jgi:hypothetical protein
MGAVFFVSSLIHDHQFDLVDGRSCLYSHEINARRNRPTVLVRAVPGHALLRRRPMRRDQVPDNASVGVVHAAYCRCILFKLIGDRDRTACGIGMDIDRYFVVRYLAAVFLNFHAVEAGDLGDRRRATTSSTVLVQAHPVIAVARVDLNAPDIARVGREITEKINDRTVCRIQLKNPGAVEPRGGIEESVGGKKMSGNASVLLAVRDAADPVDRGRCGHGPDHVAQCIAAIDQLRHAHRRPPVRYVELAVGLIPCQADRVVDRRAVELAQDRAGRGIDLGYPLVHVVDHPEGVVVSAVLYIRAHGIAVGRGYRAVLGEQTVRRNDPDVPEGGVYVIHPAIGRVIGHSVAALGRTGRQPQPFPGAESNTS